MNTTLLLHLRFCHYQLQQYGGYLSPTTRHILNPPSIIQDQFPRRPPAKFFLFIYQRFFNGVRCSKTKETPRILKIVVSGATEILRLFSSFNKNELYEVIPEQKYETSATCLDDIMVILKSDYDSAYFVTGNFTSGIYAEDCIFEDPTIKFSGRDLYSRNLKLLVPFFDHPSISLQSITKVLNGETESVKASWSLRTYLNLPWRPLISIDGTTVYDLDNQFRIVKHVESWSVSPFEAIAQIFTPSSGSSI